MYMITRSDSDCFTPVRPEESHTQFFLSGVFILSITLITFCDVGLGENVAIIFFSYLVCICS